MSLALALRMLNTRIACACLLIVFFTLSLLNTASNRNGLNISQHFPSAAFPYVPGTSAPRGPKPANATLDFQEILYISMPYRTDRQDAMSLIAASTGLKIKLIPGVDTTTMHTKAKPLNPGTEKERYDATLVGVWRAHANAWRYIIENDISSALIIEDDVDWDVNIKDIMGLWNWQLKHNNSLDQTSPQHYGLQEECEYGCDWDELFMGQCANKPDPQNLAHFTYTDPLSPPVSQHAENIVNEMTNIWNYSSSDSAFRIVSPTYDPLCTMGYAVSRIGAMRMLYQIGGWRGFGGGVDNEISWRTQDGKLRGWTLTPPIFTAWRTGGSRDSDNDMGIDSQGLGEKGNMGGWSDGIVRSARRAMAEVLDVDRRLRGNWALIG